MRKLLIDESPLVVLPSLAQAIGLPEAIILQQVHFWTRLFRQAGDMRHYKDGFWWVWNSGAEWAENFPFWSEKTVRRHLAKLRETFNPSRSQADQGMLARAALLATGNYNRLAGDKTLWYRVNYRELERLEKAMERLAETHDPEPEDPTSQLPLLDFQDPEPRKKLEIREGETTGDALRRRVQERRGETDWGALDPDRAKRRPWGDDSPTVNRRLREASVDGHAVRQLGRYLEEQLGMAPAWGNAKDTKRWITGLIELHQIVGGDHNIARKAHRKLREDHLTVDSPYSLMKVARSIATEGAAKGPEQYIDADKVEAALAGIWRK